MIKIHNAFIIKSTVEIANYPHLLRSCGYTALVPVLFVFDTYYKMYLIAMTQKKHDLQPLSKNTLTIMIFLALSNPINTTDIVMDSIQITSQYLMQMSTHSPMKWSCQPTRVILRTT